MKLCNDLFLVLSKISQWDCLKHVAENTEKYTKTFILLFYCGFIEMRGSQISFYDIFKVFWEKLLH